MQPCASLLARCFIGDPKLAHYATQLPGRRTRRYAANSCRVSITQIETVLGLLHEGKEKAIRVEELTQIVNALLHSRGERWVYSHEAIGRQLADMGVERERNSSGQRVILERTTSQRVHQKALSFGLAQKYAQANCPDCEQISQVTHAPVM